MATAAHIAARTTTHRLLFFFFFFNSFRYSNLFLSKGAKCLESTTMSAFMLCQYLVPLARAPTAVVISIPTMTVLFFLIAVLPGHKSQSDILPLLPLSSFTSPPAVVCLSVISVLFSFLCGVLHSGAGCQTHARKPLSTWGGSYANHSFNTFLHCQL